MPSECSVRRTIEVLAVLFLVAGIMATGAVFIWLRHTRLSATVPEDTFCCPSVVRLLLEASNLSVDPCQDFYRYTCYNWDRKEKTSRLNALLLQRVMTPAYTRGTDKSPAARTISTAYSACLVTLIGSHSGLYGVVRAVLTTLKPTLAPTPTEMFHFLIRITLLYGMTPGLVVENSEEGASIRLHISNIHIWNSKPALANRENALQVFNTVMSSNLSWEGVKRLGTMGYPRGDVKSRLSVSETSLVAGLVSNVKLRVWKRVWEEYAAEELPKFIAHGNLALLKRYLDVIVSGVQPTGLALMTIEASVQMWQHYNVERAKGLGSLCQYKTAQFGLLWDMVVTEALVDPDKDRILRQMYTAVSEQIVLHAASLFPEDVDVIRRKVSEVTLFLPSDMHLLDIEPPKEALPYWSMMLALKDYELTVKRHQRYFSLPRYRYGGLKYNDVQHSTSPPYLIVPPSRYAALDFTPGVEAVVNMAVVGADLALVWRTVLDDASAYGPRTADFIRRFTECLSTKEDTHGILRLRLETGANASGSSKWHTALGHLGISRSRIFYMSYVLHNVCTGWEHRFLRKFDPMAALAGAPDFLQSYRCSPAQPAGGYCRLGVSR